MAAVIGFPYSGWTFFQRSLQMEVFQTVEVDQGGMPTLNH